MYNDIECPAKLNVVTRGRSPLSIANKLADMILHSGNVNQQMVTDVVAVLAERKDFINILALTVDRVKETE